MEKRPNDAIPSGVIICKIRFLSQPTGTSGSGMCNLIKLQATIISRVYQQGDGRCESSAMQRVLYVLLPGSIFWRLGSLQILVLTDGFRVILMLLVASLLSPGLLTNQLRFLEDNFGLVGKFQFRVLGYYNIVFFTVSLSVSKSIALTQSSNLSCRLSTKTSKACASLSVAKAVRCAPAKLTELTVINSVRRCEIPYRLAWLLKPKQCLLAVLFWTQNWLTRT